MGDRSPGTRLNKRPIRSLISRADQRGPLRIRDNLRQANFRGQIRDSVPLVLAEELITRAASPDIHRPYDFTLMD